MTFLQPFVLIGLPLIGLPILIHLINRQRHRTVPWGAMMFLLDAQRLQKNMAKLRYWLIMAMRMLAVAGILFAASRPFASGWLGSAVGSRAETVIVLLDRSPSMEQQDPLTRLSKRATAIEKLARFWETAGGNRRLLLVENTRYQAEEVDAAQLSELPTVAGCAASSDIPRMFQTALDYVVDNELGQADVWVASDLREHDWRPEDGRWAALRQAFAEREGIRFHLLAYPQPSKNNLSVAIRNVRKRTLGDDHELLLDVVVRREQAEQLPQNIPLEFVVNGARSLVEIVMDKDEYVLQGHAIPVDHAVQSGWGRVEIPGDDNPADNSALFVFADEPTRVTTIVSDDALTLRPLNIAATRGTDPALALTATSLPVARVAEVDWAGSTLVIWQAPLPTGLVADQMQAFLDSGRPILFFPPEAPTVDAFAGLRWGSWQTPGTNDPVGIASMLGDSDLLARTESGAALPLHQQRTLRYCKLDGTGKSLARFTNGDPLLLRASNDVPAYFCATLPRAEYSSMARDGIVLYVLVQRALAIGATQQGDARNAEAGSRQLPDMSGWRPLSALPAEAVSSSRPFFAAAYELRDGTLFSVNRAAGEDATRFVTDSQLENMLAGLDYHRINDDAGQGTPLANEIWRVFLALMAIALIVEASLCLH